MQTGLNSWLRRIVYRTDPDLYRRVFSFSQVTRAEHHSPFLIEIGVALGVGVGAPAVLLFGCLAAVHFIRRREAEARIREAEARIKEEEAEQQHLRTQMMAQMAEAVRATDFKGRISDAVMQEVVKINSTPVADLGKSSLIGEVTIGLSAQANGK
jgi:hypothetical protein